MNTRRVGAAIAVLAIMQTTPALASPSAPTDVAPTAAQPAVISMDVVNAVAAGDFWTPARMASAQPYQVTPASGVPAASAASAVPTGPAKAIGSDGTVTGVVGNPGGGGVSAAAFSYPFPYQRWELTAAQAKAAPNRQNGKVFFSNNGGNYVCSGTAVVAPNRLRVWTAGHCLANGDGAHQWSTNVIFVPGYDSTSATPTPYGVWPAGQLTVTTSWFNSCACTVAAFATDLGAFNVAVTNGKTLHATVGSAGFAYNQSSNQQYISHGYPAAAPFGGGKQVHCIGATAVLDGGGSPNPIGIGCDMTGGSSGGSWVIGFINGGSSGYINGHNDYKYNNQSGSMYSPYFDGLANAVRCANAGTGGGC